MIAKVGRGGSISLVTNIASTDQIVDVMGYLPGWRCMNWITWSDSAT